MRAAEVEVSGMVRGGAAAEPSRMGCRVSGSGVPCHDRVARVWKLRAKALAGILVGRDDGGALGRRFPIGGVILKQQPCYTGFSGENPVQFLDERRRRLWRRVLLGGVVF